LAVALKPFTVHAIDLAGALISPLLALFGGWFLWWWSRRMKFRYRWAALILYAISPVLVKGTELGRPDHQSLLTLLVTVAICAEWTLQFERSTKWGIVSGTAWSFALWVSLYEPLILLFLVVFLRAVQDRQLLFGKQRRAGWILFAVIVALAFAIERRIPSLSIFHSGELFENWARTIGELAHVWPANPIWLRWGGYLLLLTPLLIWFGVRKREVGAPGGRTAPIFVLALLVTTYLLTIWQARWAYFFFLIFAIALPALLEPINSRAAVWIAFTLSIFPILRDWDTRLWPSNSGTNLCSRATWQSICNRPRRARFLRRGGFRRRSHIGRDSLAWLEARMRACRESRTAYASFWLKTGERPVRFWSITESLG